MKLNVLDHGYVEFIEPWGSGRDGKNNKDGFPSIHEEDYDYEVGIIEAARMSTSGAFRGWDEDNKLLTYLYTNKHATPFEFAGMVLEVQAPLFVFREWHRHRTQSYNEMSARYIPLPELYYHCPVDEIIERAGAATSNKQAGSLVTIPDIAGIRRWENADRHLSQILEDHYQLGLKVGVPKELARKKMPVDHYSRMRCSANLRNWLSFMTLRSAPNAQKEIRIYSNAVEKVISAYFPNVYRLWAEEIKNVV